MKGKKERRRNEGQERGKRATGIEKKEENKRKRESTSPQLKINREQEQTRS